MGHTDGPRAPTTAAAGAPSSPRRPGARRLAGAAATMLVVGMGVTAVLLTRSHGGPQPDTGGTAAGGGAGDPEDVEFDLVDGLCESVDYSALDAVYLFFPAEVEGRRSTGPPEQAICTLDRSAPSSVTAGGPLGLLVVNVAVYDTSEAARVAYDDLRTARPGFRDHPEAHTRGWDDAAVLRERTNYGSEVEVMTRDGVLFLNLRLAISSWSEPPDLDAQQAALVEVGLDVREVLRR